METKTINLSDFQNSGVAEIEASYKNKIKPSEMMEITTSQESYEYIKSAWSDKIEYIEEFYIILLNRANKALGWVKISQGGISGTVFDPKLIFQIALTANASCVILAHNHPSGNLKPSQSDIIITNKLVEGGKLLEINVLDHLIISTDGYYSFSDHNKI